ncbi:MAG TPA: cysteine--tRNA ligase, partial [Saprospirales bacterium]|nr:cysteine--tRNA ligase [Saprospirales bacterium]
MLQSHYRSTLDLTDEALQAAEKGYYKLTEGLKALEKLTTDQAGEGQLDQEINGLLDLITDDMNDDFNTPKAISRLFDLTNYINKLKDGHLAANAVGTECLEHMKRAFKAFFLDVFGLSLDSGAGQGDDIVEGLMGLVIAIRQKARENKNWET